MTLKYPAHQKLVEIANFADMEGVVARKGNGLDLFVLILYGLDIIEPPKRRPGMLIHRA